jgi:hypothetical protein
MLMKHKRYEEGGEVEDYEKTGADYDDERAEDSLQMRIAKAQSENARPTTSKPAPRKVVKEAPKAAPKAAPKVAESTTFRGLRAGNKDQDRAGFNPSRLYAAGGAVSASRRADGCAQRGKTRGKMI